MKAPSLPPNTLRWPKRVSTRGEAVKYIDAAGFCMLFPVKNIPLTSLYYAVTRRNPQSDFVWDRYVEMLWKWKDELPQRKSAYYAKYFRGRGTFISREQLPFFLAMRETAVESNDHEHFYAEGRIREDARAIWEAIGENGPLATLELRNICKMDSKAGNVRFKRAVADLQCVLVLVHFGTEQETGAWASARYELTCRAFPKETAAARKIAPGEARRMLAAKFVACYPGAAHGQVARLFGWTKVETAAAMEYAGDRRITKAGKRK